MNRLKRNRAIANRLDRLPPAAVIGGLTIGWLGLQIPLLRAPAACWCARATVESTDTSQVITPWPARLRRLLFV